MMRRCCFEKKLILSCPTPAHFPPEFLKGIVRKSAARTLTRSCQTSTVLAALSKAHHRVSPSPCTPVGDCAESFQHCSQWRERFAATLMCCCQSLRQPVAMSLDRSRLVALEMVQSVMQRKLPSQQALIVNIASSCDERNRWTCPKALGRLPLLVLAFH